MFVINLDEGAIYFYVLAATGYQLVKKQVDASRNYSCIILILFNAAKEGYLFLFAILGKLSPDDVAPVAAEHGVGFPTAGLSVG